MWEQIPLSTLQGAVPKAWSLWVKSDLDIKL